jgi:hypothetical protein
MVDAEDNFRRKSQRSGLRTSYKDVDFCREYNQISETESAASIQIKVCNHRKFYLKENGKREHRKKVTSKTHIMHDGGGVDKKRKRNVGSMVSNNDFNVSTMKTSSTSSSNCVTNSSRIMFDSRILDDCGVEPALEQANMSYFCGGEAQREGEHKSDGMCCCNCVCD